MLPYIIIYSIHGSYGYSNGDPNGRNGDPVAGQGAAPSLMSQGPCFTPMLEAEIAIIGTRAVEVPGFRSRAKVAQMSSTLWNMIRR
jgi:hypothetical protein